MDILAIGEHSSLLLTKLIFFYCACASTATFELPVKILTLPLDSAIIIS